MLISHVEAVGWHLQLLGHPWTNEMLNRCWKPNSGSVFVRDIHFKRPRMVTSPTKEIDHKQVCQP